jgi:ABC-type sugar transport system substrate-binding protein
MRPDGFLIPMRKLPGVKIVTEQDAWKTADATTVVENILTAHPDLTMVWGANEGGTLGSVLAVKNKGMAGKVVVFGTDMSKQTAEFLLSDDNILQAVTGQKPFDMGHMAVEMAVKILKGEKVDKKVFTPLVLYSRDKPEEVKKYLVELEKLTK